MRLRAADRGELVDTVNPPGLPCRRCAFDAGRCVLCGAWQQTRGEHMHGGLGHTHYFIEGDGHDHGATR